ncbi:hypothetical protein LZ30DRAFT_705984 [Colletotrichum cereale]|nr:hypothetical protein LZ30DRAFT_705984 [Colletotrichum cereale]
MSNGPGRIPADHPSSQLSESDQNRHVVGLAGLTTLSLVRLFDSGNPLPDAADVSLGPPPPHRERFRIHPAPVSDFAPSVTLPTRAKASTPPPATHCGLPPARPLFYR